MFEPWGWAGVLAMATVAPAAGVAGEKGVLVAEALLAAAVRSGSSRQVTAAVAAALWRLLLQHWTSWTAGMNVAAGQPHVCRQPAPEPTLQ